MPPESSFYNVALIGNPNTGKTTLFNALTGLNQKVANYPGVTVERKEGEIKIENESIRLIDLPGTYSLSPHSLDEKIVHDVLTGKVAGVPKIDLVLMILDASHLERHLFLATQVAEQDLPMIFVLNQMDVAESQGIQINIEEAQKILGAPVVPAVANRQKGIAELKKAIIRFKSNPQICAMPVLQLPAEFNIAEKQLQTHLQSYNFKLNHFDFVQMLINDDYLKLLGLDQDQNLYQLIEEQRKLIELKNSNWITLDAQLRYQMIYSLCKKFVERGKSKAQRFSEKVDQFLIHPVGGLIFFAGIMYFVFQSIFTWAQLPMQLVDSFFVWLGQVAVHWIPTGDFQSLVVDGVIGGVGSVLVFLPQILILFFFIVILEDSGYLARAAFILDRIMATVGLTGRSFIPLLSSFACAIPGIMSTRTIQNPKDRLATILIAPWMSCSARLPIYSVLIAAFIPKAWQGFTMWLLFFLGMLGAYVVSFLFRKTILKGGGNHFLMELPAYKWPNFKNVWLSLWERSYAFVQQAGTIIFIFAVLLWILSYYPKHTELTGIAALEYSFLGRMGHVIEPLIAPLGFDWKIGIAILSSLPAREVFVTTLSIIYAVGNQTGSTTTLLIDQLKNAMTPLTGVTILIFYVYAMQCLSTLAVVRRELNTWKWPLFMLIYQTGVAYGAALVVFRLGKFLGF
jgi:ferrous iron transport protein B